MYINVFFSLTSRKIESIANRIDIHVTYNNFVQIPYPKRFLDSRQWYDQPFRKQL